MRILQLIQKRQLRGAEIFASQLSTHLVEAGHEVRIVALGGGNSKLPFAGEIFSLEANFKNRFFDLSAWKKLAGIIRDFNPDIVQANSGDTLKYAVFSKKAFRWKQPVIFRNASMVSSYIKSFISKKLTAYLFKNVARFISVSQYTKKDLEKSFAISGDKISVIPVGIELGSPHKLPLFENNFINLIHVGGFSFEKNHEGLLSIFQHLLQQNNVFRLWLVGDGPLKEKIHQQAKQLGIDDKIFFTGFINEPLDYINSANLLVLPSIIEGLPAVIMEAFYCKIPVVAYDVGGIAELVKNDETGWLINAGNEREFAAAILKLSRYDQKEIEPIVENAYKKIIGMYTNKKITISFVELYKNVAN